MTANPLRHRVSIVVGRLQLLLVVALVGATLQAAFTGDVVGAICAVGIIAAELLSAWLTVVAVIAGLTLGASLPAALGAAMALVGFASPVLARAGMQNDITALTGVAAVLPEDLRRRLRALAGDEPVSTSHALDLAVADDPGAWRPVVSSSAAGRFDGPVVDDGHGGRCTQFFAEAVGVALVLADRDRPLDTGLLAVAAALVPLSACTARTREGPGVLDIRSVTPAEGQRALTGFSQQPAGVAMMVRVEAEVLARREGREVSPEEAAGLRHRDLVRDQIRVRSLRSRLMVLVVLELSWDLVKWIVRLPWTVAKAVARLLRARPVDRLQRSWATVRKGAVGLLASWDGWPPGWRALWLSGRPVLGVAAVAGAVALDGPLAGAATFAAAFVVGRALRPWPVSVAAALAAGLVTPVGGALVLARAGLTASVFRRMGRDRVAEARAWLANAVTQVPVAELDSVRAGFAAAVRAGDEDAILDSAAAYAVAAWAQGRTVELWRIVRVMARGLALGRWPGAEAQTDFDSEMRRLLFFEESSALVARLAAIAAAAAAAAAIVPVATPLGDGPVVSRVVAAVGAALIATPLTARQPGFIPAAITAGIVWLLAGPEALRLVLLGIAAGIIASLLRTRFSKGLLAGRARWRAWPAPPGTPIAQRRHWKAANAAIDAGRVPIGAEMLRDLAEDGATTEGMAAAALGRMALLDVDRGRLNDAAVALDRLSQRSLQETGGALVAAGLLQTALGDLAQAEDSLRRAQTVLEPRSVLGPRAGLALAEVLAWREKPDEAIALLTEQRSRALTLLGLDMQLETEGVICAALIARGDLDVAAKRLEEATGFSFGDPAGRPDNPDWTVQRRLARAEARLLLLQAQLELDRGDTESALKTSRTAYERLPEGIDRTLRATAQVLHGATLVHTGLPSRGVGLIRAGMSELEAQRRQLSAGTRRTDMIIAREKVHAWALRGLTRASELGIGEAGEVAATLIESLRHSAIAEALQGVRGGLGPVAAQLASEIGDRQRADALRSEDDAPATDPVVDDLLAQLADEVSERFADAYVPQEITADQLRAAARRHGHLLAFYVPSSGLPGWRSWIAPDGTARVDEIVVGSDVLAAWFAEVARQGGFPRATVHEPLTSGDPLWRELGDLLLPDGLRAVLADTLPDHPARLVVVPDGALSLVPWAALEVAGRPLVHRAVIAVMSAATLITAPPRRPVWSAPQGVVAHVADDAAGASADAAELLPMVDADIALEVATTREAFVDALRGRRCAGAYLAMHGNDTGLRQNVRFGDGSVLSAAVALGLPWPSWVLLASCLVGRVELVAGQEPLGLAISCMLGGADDVVASLVEITDVGAASICGPLAADLAAGVDPAMALRAAQLRRLEQLDWPTLADGLGLICMSTARVHDRPSSRSALREGERIMTPIDHGR